MNHFPIPDNRVTTIDIVANGGPRNELPKRDRDAHARMLLERYASAIEEAKNARKDSGIEDQMLASGFYIDFKANKDTIDVNQWTRRKPN